MAGLISTIRPIKQPHKNPGFGSAFAGPKCTGAGDWTAAIFTMDGIDKKLISPLRVTVLNALGAAKVFYVFMFEKRYYSAVLTNLASASNYYNANDFEKLIEDEGHILWTGSINDNASESVALLEFQERSLREVFFVVTHSSTGGALNDYMQASASFRINEPQRSLIG